MVQRRVPRFVFNDYSSFSHVPPMLECLEWDSLKDRRLVLQASMFYKIYAGDVAILFPPEVRPLTRVSRSPNHHPFHQLSVSNNVYKYRYSFFPRSIVTWNNLPMNASVNSLDKFNAVALPLIKSLL